MPRRDRPAAQARASDRLRGFAKDAVEICATAKTVPLRASGQSAIAYYSEDKETGRFWASAIDVLTFEGTRIKEITAFVTPQAFSSFGLPPELAPDNA